MIGCVVTETQIRVLPEMYRKYEINRLQQSSLHSVITTLFLLVHKKRIYNLRSKPLNKKEYGWKEMESPMIILKKIRRRVIPVHNN